MRKYFQYMRWKMWCAPFFLLLMVSMTTTCASATDPTSVYVYPPSATISTPGASVTVEINVTDVTNLYGYDVFVKYESTILEVISFEVTGPGQVVPPSSSDYTVSDVSSPSIGMLGINVGFLEEPNHPPSFNGSGTLLWVTFKGKKVGVSALDLDATALYTTTLWNRNQDPIPDVTLNDGEITVVPEFPAAVVASLLLIATLAATLTAKIVWSRKRRDPAIP